MRRTLLACWIGALLPFATVVAQDSASRQSVSWGIMAGGDFTTGKASNPQSSGATVGVLAQFPIESSHFAIRLDAMFHYLPVNCGSFAVCSPGTPGSLSANVVARLNSSATRWSPYAIAGVAGFLNEYWSFGLAGGAGFEVGDAKHALFLEARYMRMAAAGLVPVTLGVRF
jgi:hypothetical protein